jgi:hypothetical protein
MLPSTVRVTGIPENTDFRNETIKYSTNYKLDERTVTATRRLVKDYKSHICGQEENQEWLDALKSIKRDQRSLIFYE